MKILYFTGTGNCLSVAKHFDAELLSIPQLVKDNIYEIEDDTVGIVYPVYAISIPDIVRKYLSQCKIKANYAEFVKEFVLFQILLKKKKINQFSGVVVKVALLVSIIARKTLFR